MALTIAQANAISSLLRYIGRERVGGGFPVAIERVTHEAGLLAEHVNKALQAGPRPDEARDAVQNLAREREQSLRTELALLLLTIACHDRDYEIRNRLVRRAVRIAVDLGYPAGYAWDHNPEALPDFRLLAYVEPPTGQMAWHLPNEERMPTPLYIRLWDGHSTDLKYERGLAYADDVLSERSAER